MNLKIVNFLLVFLLVLLVTLTLDQSVEASPGRRKSSTSSGGGWFSSGKKNKNNYNNNYNSKKYNNNYGGKKKSSLKKNLMRGAVIGATAYGAYQIGKLSGRFSGGYGGGGYGHGGYGFNEWNRWREVDGFMCRNNEDCVWMDRNLYCQDYELDFTPMQGWFGGDYLSIVGECACSNNQVWNDYELQCEHRGFGGGGIGVILITILVLLILLCCCVGGTFYIVRRFF